MTMRLLRTTNDAETRLEISIYFDTRVYCVDVLNIVNMDVKRGAQLLCCHCQRHKLALFYVSFHFTSPHLFLWPLFCFDCSIPGSTVFEMHRNSVTPLAFYQIWASTVATTATFACGSCVTEYVGFHMKLNIQLLSTPYTRNTRYTLHLSEKARTQS